MWFLYKKGGFFWEMHVSKNIFLGHFLATANVSFILNYINIILYINKHTFTLHLGQERPSPESGVEPAHTDTSLHPNFSSMGLNFENTEHLQDSILLQTLTWLYISFRSQPGLGVEVHLLLTKPILTRNRIPGQLLLSITPERSKEQSPHYPCASKELRKTFSNSVISDFHWFF